MEAVESIKHPSRYARNLLEYCCFRTLALSIQVMGHLADKRFRRLTYDMMVAWEAPAAASQPLLNVSFVCSIKLLFCSRTTILPCNVKTSLPCYRCNISITLSHTQHTCAHPCTCTQCRNTSYGHPPPCHSKSIHRSISLAGLRLFLESLNV